MKNTSATEPVSLTIDGHPAVQDELTRTEKPPTLSSSHHRERRRSFQQILAWTLKSRWQNPERFQGCVKSPRVSGVKTTSCTISLCTRNVQITLLRRITFGSLPRQLSSTLLRKAVFSAPPYFPPDAEAMTCLESAASLGIDAVAMPALADKCLCRDPSRFFPERRCSFLWFLRPAPTA